MSYEFDDIMKCELPDRCVFEFLSDLYKLLYEVDLQNSKYSIEDARIRISILLEAEPPLEDYKKTLEYKSAATMVEKAKIAYNAKPAWNREEFRASALQCWMKYANQITDFEKTIRGWPKT